MCEISEPTVRRGIVLSFEPIDGEPPLRLSANQADTFAEYLATASYNEYQAALQASFDQMLESDLVDRGSKIEIEDQAIELFSNHPNVVRFADARIHIQGGGIVLGCSATVCQDDGQSKVWVRVSEKLSSTDSEGASCRLLRLSKIAECAANAFAEMYQKLLREHSKQLGLPELGEMSYQHVFLIEAADYDSAKLYDTVRTLRNTNNFFTVADRKNWGPVKDLFILASQRFDEGSGFQEHTNHTEPTREFISSLTKYFNETNATVTWDVTLGRHGLFAVDEITPDKNSGASRTHMVGICSDHGNVNSTYDSNYASSWLVSGQMAPKLGAFF